MEHDFQQMAQRWISYYAQLPGRRAEVRTEKGDQAETVYILGQEHNFLIASREPFTGDPEQRSYLIIDTRTLQHFKLLAGPDPAAGQAAHQSEAPMDPANMTCALGRLTIHALTPSGTRSHLEVAGLEPTYGGYFVNANHCMGFALQHLHLELQRRGLVGPGELPLRPNFWEVEVKSATAPLPVAVKPPVTLAVYMLETKADQLAGVTVPALGENPGKALSTPDRVMAWGYEQLCQEAVGRRLLPGSYVPRVRRAQLH